jgi:GNAT superfamily N-acetyltransferase
MIRDATLADVPQLVAMGQRFRTSSRYAAVLRDNPAQLARMAEGLIAGDHGHVWVSADDAGALSGMLGVIRFDHPMSGDLNVGELFYWVNPESRGNGVRLLRRAEAWARDQGAAAILMIAPDQTDVGALYARLGYTAVETAWSKRLAA